MTNSVHLHESWKTALNREFEAPYMQSLRRFLQQEKQSGVTIYPPGSQIFAALDLTPLDKVRVVILGQDPYHGPGQAHGLCFSVNDGIPHPPSLQNIFKELRDDCGCTIPVSGNLTAWADQGVLLLNATLTVRANQAGSHQKKGWEQFTDQIIRTISAQREHVVFLLWGRFAQSKIPLIDTSRHCILTAAHPSPLSAYNGFYGCKHFSKTNDWLKSNGMKEINWCTPELK